MAIIESGINPFVEMESVAEWIDNGRGVTLTEDGILLKRRALEMIKEIMLIRHEM